MQCVTKATEQARGQFLVAGKWRAYDYNGFHLHAPSTVSGLEVQFHKVGHNPKECRMGEDPASSVADPEFRGHDTPKLYVFSGGFFPTYPGMSDVRWHSPRPLYHGRRILRDRRYGMLGSLF